MRRTTTSQAVSESGGSKRWRATSVPTTSNPAAASIAPRSVEGTLVFQTLTDGREPFGPARSSRSASPGGTHVEVVGDHRIVSAISAMASSPGGLSRS